jgi:hypothetical protein
MKRLIAYLLPLIAISCTNNHYHDGKYQASVFTDGSMSWVRNEEIELRGSDMYYRSLSLADNSILNELKITCVQYEGHIEFKNKDGITVIARIDEDGNIKYGEYTYKKVGDEEPVTETANESVQPLIKNNGDGTITLNDEKKKGEPEETVETTATNFFFTGTKKFSDGDGWEYLVTIKGKEITLKLYPTANNEFYSDKKKPKEVITGHIEGGEIITPENSFRIESGALYELNNEGGWNEFRMVK